jgi:hypothetical protein
MFLTTENSLSQRHDLANDLIASGIALIEELDKGPNVWGVAINGIGLKQGQCP